MNEKAKTIQSLRFLSVDATIEMQMTAGGLRGEHPFVALITYAGRSSDHPVGGTELIKRGPYRVFIPTDLMRRKIRELEGCSVFAEERLDSHKQTKPVGEFTAAWVEPHDTPDGRLVLAARASGLLSTGKHAQLVDGIIAEAREGKLGFSYDIKDILYTLEAHEVFADVQVVKIIDFNWRGATILKREVAAYSFTELAAREKEARTAISIDHIREAAKQSVETALNNEEAKMNDNELKQMREAIAEAITVAVDPLKAEVSTLKTTVASVQTELKAKGEVKPEPKPEAKKPETPAEPKSIGTVDDLVKGIGDQFKAAIAPLSEKLDKMVNPEPKAKPEGEEKTEGKEQKAPEVKAEAKNTEGKTEEKPRNVRKSHDATTLTLLARFTPESFNDGSDEVTPDQLHAACRQIEKDDKLSAAEKSQMISVFSNQRRTMLKQEWRKGLR